MPVVKSRQRRAVPRVAPLSFNLTDVVKHFIHDKGNRTTRP